MRILLTGRSGQMGRAIAHLTSGHEIIAAGRPEIEFERPQTIYDLVGSVRPDVVINCAGLTNVDACETVPDIAFAINADAPGHLSAAAKQQGASIIHLSTDYVFGGQAGMPYREDDDPLPINVYGRSKLSGEDHVMAANPRHVVVRVSWVYSLFANNFPTSLLRYAETRSEISVVDDQISCPTSGIELAEALLKLAVRMRERACYGRFHLAGDDPVDRATLGEAVMAWAAANGLPSASVKRIGSHAFKTPAPRPLYTALDSTKVRDTYDLSLTGWRSWLPDMLQACTARSPKPGEG